MPEKPKAKVPDCVLTRYKWAERLNKKLPEHGHILCTLVDEIEGDNLNGRVFGNVIVLPDFGTIFSATTSSTGIRRVSRWSAWSWTGQ